MSWLREPDAEPLPGYFLLEPLGSGGFGEVWSCRAPGGILKAIKFIYGNLNAEDADAARAEQEKLALNRVKEVRHPFVVSMDRIEEIDGELLIVMELAERSLHDCFVGWQQQGRPGIPRGDLIRYLSDVAEGLDYLIDRFSLLHLDVKPRNLLLVAERVKVADFGLVKNIDRPSSAGVMAGVTPIYAAPETFGGKITRHSDQYSLGIVYVELLTGKRPFQGKNVRQIALQHMTEPPNLDGLPPGDRAAVARALAKDPDKRFPNCLSFIRALSQATTAAEVVDLSDEVDLGHRTPGPIEPHGNSDHGEPPPTRDLSDAIQAARDAIAAPVGPSPVVVHDSIKAPARPTADPRIRVAPPKRDGVLRPTLYVGIGTFGRHALLELRTRLLDRFGDLGQLPAVRFLYLDSDPDASQKATAGTSEVVLNAGEVFPMPLQPVVNYRRRMLDHLTEWLPREKLYSIPRSLQPCGTRALGRLAFVDSFLRLQARLRRDLMQATHPDALQQSADFAGLPVGDASPVVVVLAGAIDGMSGVLTDFGYGLRRLLDQLAYPHATTEALVYCGSPFDPATPSGEQANLYATLTELNHYSDPDVSFIAYYSPDTPPLADPRPPFDRITLTLRRDRTRQAERECLAHAATYLTNVAATRLGGRLEQLAADSSATQLTPFRGFGTSTTWYPRGLLLRVAARRACEKIIEVWRDTGPANALGDAEARAGRAFADDGLRPERLAAALEQLAVSPGDGTPTEATERFLQGLEVMGAGAEEIGMWTAQALERIREWAGPGSGFDPESTWKKSRFYRPLMAAAAKLSEEWDEKLKARVLKVLRQPYARLSNGEAGLRRLMVLIDEAAAAQLAVVQRHYEATLPVRDGLVAAQQACAGGGFKLFGGPQRSLRHFHAQLRDFARLRVRQDVLEIVLVFYKSLRGRLEDRIQELNFARQRLKALQLLLAASMADDEPFGNASKTDASPPPAYDAFWNAVQGSETVDIILPGGETDLETSAGQFVAGLTDKHWLELDNQLHEKVLQPQGNLLSACTGNTNLLKYLGRPLLDEAANYLGAILPIDDVAQVEFTATRGTDALGEELFKRHAAAAPAVGPSAPEGNLSVVLVPDSDAGRSLAEVARSAIPTLEVFATQSLTELTFCRVSQTLSMTDLEQLLNLSRLAYQETAPQPASSPHSRFDVLEWVPLEP